MIMEKGGFKTSLFILLFLLNIASLHNVSSMIATNYQSNPKFSYIFFALI